MRINGSWLACVSFIFASLVTLGSTIQFVSIFPPWLWKILDSNFGWLHSFWCKCVCENKCEDLFIGSNVFLNFLRGLKMLVLGSHLYLSPIGAWNFKCIHRWCIEEWYISVWFFLFLFFSCILNDWQLSCRTRIWKSNEDVGLIIKSSEFSCFLLP